MQQFTLGVCKVGAVVLSDLESVTLDVKAGQTYYIKGEVGVGFLVGRPHLMVVAPDIAEKEIADCKLIPTP